MRMFTACFVVLSPQARPWVMACHCSMSVAITADLQAGNQHRPLQGWRVRGCCAVVRMNDCVHTNLASLTRCLTCIHMEHVSCVSNKQCSLCAPTGAEASLFLTWFSTFFSRVSLFRFFGRFVWRVRGGGNRSREILRSCDDAGYLRTSTIPGVLAISRRWAQTNGICSCYQTQFLRPRLCILIPVACRWTPLLSRYKFCSFSGRRRKPQVFLAMKNWEALQKHLVLWLLMLQTHPLTG